MTKAKEAATAAPRKVKAPVFREDLPHGEIFGSGDASSVTHGARFVQNGHYFGGDHKYLRSDADAVFVAHVEPDEQVVDPGTRQVDDTDLAALETNERGQKMLKLPLDRLAALVKQAGGPSYSGDNALRLNAAWLLKHVPFGENREAA